MKMSWDYREAPPGITKDDIPYGYRPFTICALCGIALVFPGILIIAFLPGIIEAALAITVAVYVTRICLPMFIHFFTELAVLVQLDRSLLWKAYLIRPQDLLNNPSSNEVVGRRVDHTIPLIIIGGAALLVAVIILIHLIAPGLRMPWAAFTTSTDKAPAVARSIQSAILIEVETVMLLMARGVLRWYAKLPKRVV